MNTQCFFCRAEIENDSLVYVRFDRANENEPPIVTIQHAEHGQIGPRIADTPNDTKDGGR